MMEYLFAAVECERHHHVEICIDQPETFSA